MAAASIKEVMTFSTAILSLTVTFAGDKLVGTNIKIPRSLLGSWCLYLLSIAAGIWTLNALTGELALNTTPSVYGSNVSIPAGVTYAGFLLGLLGTVAAGYQALLAKRKSGKSWEAFVQHFQKPRVSDKPDSSRYPPDN